MCTIYGQIIVYVYYLWSDHGISVLSMVRSWYMCTIYGQIMVYLYYLWSDHGICVLSMVRSWYTCTIYGQIQIASGFPDPHINQMPHLRQVLKGVKVQAGRTGKTLHPRLPITPSILMKLREVWLQGTSFNNTML